MHPLIRELQPITKRCIKEDDYAPFTGGHDNAAIFTSR